MTSNHFKKQYLEKHRYMKEIQYLLVFSNGMINFASSQKKHHAFFCFSVCGLNLFFPSSRPFLTSQTPNLP